MEVQDKFGRNLRDLRISVTDKCNFRCRYCMPAEIFGPSYAFLPKDELLSFEEITQLIRAMIPMGVGKIRLTGGEPLLRRNIAELITMISTIEGIHDIAMTTNGTLLAHHSEELALAGLNRVTVSLDALDPEIFRKMNGTGAKINSVIAGITAAKNCGLPVKVNTVIQRGVNETEILPLAHWAKQTGIDLRFIEYMDVGETNGWNMSQVVTGQEILETLSTEFKLSPHPPAYRGEVAVNWQHNSSQEKIGLIRSVSTPFCADCQRIRLSADGKLYTCLFSADGHDIRSILRSEQPQETLTNTIRGIWLTRQDRYSELRGKVTIKKAEMSYLGG